MIPIPGASAKGRFAYRPIAIEEKALTRMVAKSTPLKDIPVCEMIAGFTTMM